MSSGGKASKRQSVVGKAAAELTTRPKAICRYLAVYDYSPDPDYDDEIELLKNDVIDVTDVDVDEPDWSKGFNNRTKKVGLFPIGHCKLVASSIPKPENGGAIYEVIMKFEAEEEDDLIVELGEFVEKLQDDDENPDYTKAYHFNTKKTGFIPKNSIKCVDGSSEPVPKAKAAAGVRMSVMRKSVMKPNSGLTPTASQESEEIEILNLDCDKYFRVTKDQEPEFDGDLTLAKGDILMCDKHAPDIEMYMGGLIGSHNVGFVAKDICEEITKEEAYKNAPEAAKKAEQATFTNNASTGLSNAEVEELRRKIDGIEYTLKSDKSGYDQLNEIVNKLKSEMEARTSMEEKLNTKIETLVNSSSELVDSITLIKIKFEETKEETEKQIENFKLTLAEQQTNAASAGDKTELDTKIDGLSQKLGEISQQLSSVDGLKNQVEDLQQKIDQSENISHNAAQEMVNSACQPLKDAIEASKTDFKVIAEEMIQTTIEPVKSCTDDLKAKINELETKADHQNENFNQLSEKVTIVEGLPKTLEETKHELAESITDVNEVMKSVLNKFESLRNSSQDSPESAEKILEIEQKLNAINNTTLLDELQAKIAQIDGNLSSQSQVDPKLSQTIDAISEKVDAFDSKLQESSNAQVNYEGRFSAITQRLEELSKSLEAAEKEGNSGNNGALQQRIENIEKLINELQEKTQATGTQDSQKITESFIDKTTYEKHYKKIQSSIKLLAEKYTGHDSKFDLFESNLKSKPSTDNEDVKEKIDSLKADLSKLDKNYKRFSITTNAKIDKVKKFVNMSDD